MKNKQQVLVFVLLIAITGVVYYFYSNNSAGTEACNKLVLERLVSPGSAKFGDPVIDRPEGSLGYTINNYVDSQNSFGAMLRSNFTCTYDGSNSDPVLSMNTESN